MAEPTPVREEPEVAIPITGRAAMASKAENHTANRVLEFRSPITRSKIQAKSPMAMPSSMPFSMLEVDIRIKWFRLSSAIIICSCLFVLT
jgi:hypothetical protein